MKFYLDIIPPTCTAQMKKIAVRNGHPVMYDTEEIKKAKKLLISCLRLHKPRTHYNGPVELIVKWRFLPNKAHRDGYWRTTRPDTDNLQKLLKDCMTYCGYWKDDALVVKETAMKLWSDKSGLEIEINELEDKTDE